MEIKRNLNSVAFVLLSIFVLIVSISYGDKEKFEHKTIKNVIDSNASSFNLLWR